MKQLLLLSFVKVKTSSCKIGKKTLDHYMGMILSNPDCKDPT